MGRIKSTSILGTIPTAGKMRAGELAAKLERMGMEPVVAAEIARIKSPKAPSRGKRRGGQTELFEWGGPPPIWKYTAHQFGFIPLVDNPNGEPQPIQYAGAIKADKALKDSRVNVRLDRLRVCSYPGGGEHFILLTFKAQNQVAGDTEPVSFSRTFRALEGQAAGLLGYPLFTGLNVGKQGVAFECTTINVKNAQDVAFLDLFDSQPFRAGLDLLTTAQPVLKPFTGLTLGVARMFAKRNENVPVQDFYLGLDFSPAALGARLCEGNYIAVQVPTESELNWKDWQFQPQTGQIGTRSDGAPLPYNYVVFRVTRYEE